MLHNNNKLINKLIIISLLSCCTAAMSGCESMNLRAVGEYTNEGYVFNNNDLRFVKPGSSKKQVLLALGTPTLKTSMKHDIFYYISQRRYSPVQFLSSTIIDRKIFAVYFDNNGKVLKIANYGLKDGQLFNFLSASTPSVYQEDANILRNLLKSTKIMPSGLPTNGH